MTSDLNGKVYNSYWNFKLHTNDISKREQTKKEVSQISIVFFFLFYPGQTALPMELT